MNEGANSEIMNEIPMEPDTLVGDIAKSRFIAELSALRVQHPFIPFVPVPTAVRSIVATSADYVESVRVPSSVDVMYLTCPSGFPFFVNFRGRINFPITTDPNIENRSDALVSPVGIFFFVRGLSAFDVGIPDNGTVVSACFF